MSCGWLCKDECQCVCIRKVILEVLLFSVFSFLPFFFFCKVVSDIHAQGKVTAAFWRCSHISPTKKAQPTQQFCVQRSTTGPFSQVPVDQAIEQTVNSHSKTSGEIVGFSRKPGAVQQIVSTHQRAEITTNILEMAGMEGKDEDVAVHKEAKATQKNKDEEAVQDI